MNAKDKKKILIICLTLIFAISMIYYFISKKIEKKAYAFEENQKIDLKISNANELDIDQIIESNTNGLGFKEEIIVKDVELEYLTKYRNNSNLYVGTKKVSQKGENGTQRITTKKTYDENGEIINIEQMSAVVVKASVNKVIDIGTKVKKKKTSGNSSGIISFNIPLNKPSGLTLEQFKKVLTDPKDKNKIFQKNAKYFYYIEKEYGINGIFVAAIGIHESAWGTSKIAINKYNLFGYGAYDSNPYNGAYKFENYSESIDLIARVLVKYYLNPKGAKIYDNQKANGKYYRGNTLSAVNINYATDKNWANGVYSHMKYLYKKK